MIDPISSGPMPPQSEEPLVLALKNSGLVEKRKKRCGFHNGSNSEPPCKGPIFRFGGHCQYCDADFCMNHRLPEVHDCKNMEDCRQQAYNENKAKLESEQTVGSKIAAA